MGEHFLNVITTLLFEPIIYKINFNIYIGNAPFVMQFQPPRRLSCRVLFNDVMRASIDNTSKYVVLMVREAKDKSLFITAYDPRSATEYEVAGGPVNWKYAGINDEFQNLYEKLYPDAKQKESRISRFTSELDVCIDFAEKFNDKLPQGFEPLKIGDVLTPHLLVNVYNTRGKTDELLGSCEVCY